jgi:TrmH family RNA methyltransferase
MISKNKLKELSVYKQQKHCKEASVFVVEGVKMCHEAMAAKASIRVVCATKLWLEQHPNLPSNAEVYEVEQDSLSRLSHMTTPNEVWMLVERDLPAIPEGQSLVLALDRLQDPGNLGTIIRIADWFGITDIFCSEDTVDAWNPKVVQATMGSIARVHIYYCNLSELIDALPTDFPVYGTLLDGADIYTQPLTPHGLIVMGNEGNGISPEIRAKVNRRLLIPSYRQDDTAESLNVAIATAITCAEFRRRAHHP